MSDLIDRNVLKVKMYQEAFESDTDMQKWDSGCWIRYKLFEKVVDSTPTVPYAPRWHRVEEELPKPGQVCLVYDEDGYMSVATYTGDKYFQTAYGFHVNGEEVTDITHWMPIEPPKEE